MPGGIIKKLILAFGTKDTLSKSQLRVLLVQIAKELLNQVNSNSDIKKNLEKALFTIENVQIIIYNHDKYGSEVYSPGISTADLSEGELSYRTVNQSDIFVYDNTSTRDLQRSSPVADEPMIFSLIQIKELIGKWVRFV